MLTLLIVTLFLTLCRAGEQNVTVWGSRLISTPNGKSPQMTFYYKDGYKISIMKNNGKGDNVTVQSGYCLVDHSKWGNPCNITKDKVLLTMDEVQQLKRLTISANDKRAYPVATAYFLPKCQFPNATNDEVVLNNSFPFSRFVAGENKVELTFAVKGIKSQNEVRLEVNGQVICIWKGAVLIKKNHTACTNLTTIAKSNLRIFKANFTQFSSIKYESYFWGSNNSNLTVSVDWSQWGISPEVEQCKQYGVFLPPPEYYHKKPNATITTTTKSPGNSTTPTLNKQGNNKESQTTGKTSVTTTSSGLQTDLSPLFVGFTTLMLLKIN